MRKKEIFDLVRRSEEENHARPKFVPGKTLIHYAARQPAFRGAPIRAPFPLKVSDAVPERSFFVGIFPGLTDPMPDDMIESFRRPARAERRRPFRIARTRSPGS